MLRHAKMHKTYISHNKFMILLICRKYKQKLKVTISNGILKFSFVFLSLSFFSFFLRKQRLTKWEKQRLFIQSYYHKRVRHYHLYCGEDSSFTVGGLGYVVIGGCWQKEAVGGPTGSRASYAIGRVQIWLSLVDAKVKVRTKIRTINQTLVIWAGLFREIIA